MALLTSVARVSSAARGSGAARGSRPATAATGRLGKPLAGRPTIGNDYRVFLDAIESHVVICHW